MTGIDANIQKMKAIQAGIPADEEDDAVAAAFGFKGQLNALSAQVTEKPALLTRGVLDSLAEMAADGPFRDIHLPGAELHHRQDPRQDTCLYIIRALPSYAGIVPELADAIVDRLESLVRDNLDYDLRNEAMMSLWMLTMWGGDPQEPAFAALERQGQSNDCPYIRMLCRDNLGQTAKEHPQFAARAWDAQMGGATDPDPRARTRALALLTSRVKEEDCGYEEAENLMTLFRKAAAKAGAEEEAVRYWAAEGIGDIQTRRMKDLAERGCTTVETVTPLKPVRFKPPGG